MLKKTTASLVTVVAISLSTISPASAFGIFDSFGSSGPLSDYVNTNALPTGPGNSPEALGMTREQAEAYWSKRLFEITNEHRVSMGLPPLTWNEKLSNQAKNHAKNMSFAGDVYHSNAYDPAAPWGGENVAMMPSKRSRPNETHVRRLFTAFYNSPGHRANMERTEFKSSGIGTYINGKGQVFVAVQFERY